MLWVQIEAALAPAFARKNRSGQVMPGNDLFGTTLEIAGAGAGVSAAGQPRLPIRLMAALLYLKHAFNLSDEELVTRWSEDVVWQYFSSQDNYTPHCPAMRLRLGAFAPPSAKPEWKKYSRMEAWVMKEFAAAALGDGGLNQRLVKLATRFADKPMTSIPGACGDRSEMQAAYRFFEQSSDQKRALSWQDILAPDMACTEARMR